MGGTEIPGHEPAGASGAGGALNARDEELTPENSGLSMLEALTSPVYADLWTAKIRPGDFALDFRLPRLDFTEGVRKPTGERVSLSRFAGVKPVALIFGSYT